jgi:hypothetical protein
MRKWLAAGAILPLAAATAGHAQMKGLSPADIPRVARSHQLELRIADQHGYQGAVSLIRGMVFQRDVATNAFVGVGLANIYGRKKRSLRINDVPSRSRKPAVTFVMKF